MLKPAADPELIEEFKASGAFGAKGGASSGRRSAHPPGRQPLQPEQIIRYPLRSVNEAPYISSHSRPHRYLAGGLLLVVAVLIGVAACGGDGDSDSLTIYSGRNEELVGPLFEQFTEETGIPIEVRFGDSSDLALLVAEEGEKTPADLYLSQSPGAVGFLAERGLLAPIEATLLERVDARMRNESGLWVGVSGRQRVLVYNTELVSESDLPLSVFDLTSEEFAGRVAIAPQNDSFQDFVTAMRHLEGDEVTQAWLDGMAANDAPTYPTNSAIVEAVSRGEVPMGLVNHYYNFRFLAEDPDSPTRNFVFPNADVGALLMPATASLIAESNNRDSALAFIEFLLSEPAQSYFAAETYEYPLVPGVELAATLAPLNSLDVPDYDIEQLGGDLETTAEMISSSGLEN